MQPYVIEFMLTEGRSEVYSMQPYVIVCGDLKQIRGVLYATLCETFCDDWVASQRCASYQ